VTVHNYVIHSASFNKVFYYRLLDSVVKPISEIALAMSRNSACLV